MMGAAAGLGRIGRLASEKAGAASVAVILIIITVAHGGLLLKRNSQLFSTARDISPMTYEKLMLKSARRDAIVYIDHVADDTVAPPLYFQTVLGARRDILLFHRLYLAFPWYRDYMRDRAREQGHPARVPVINLEKEKLKSYRVGIEEYSRLLEGKTMNTVSIDIQTRRTWEENELRAAQYINTTQRFRTSVLSEGIPLEPSGFLFAMFPAREDAGFALPPPDGYVFNMLIADRLVQQAAFNAGRDRTLAAVGNLLDVLKYHRSPVVYADIAEAYAKLGDAAKSEHYKYLSLKDKIKEYDFH